MKLIKQYTIIGCLSLFFFISGIFLFAVYNEWIVFRLPRSRLSDYVAHLGKHTANLFYWHRNAWHTETQELLWSDGVAQNSEYLLSAWLLMLDEEEVLAKKVTLQSVACSQSCNELYMSFDRNPFSKEQTTHEKWLFIEGLLRTLRENKLPINQVQFLVQHQPLQDYHLDFSNPWPVSGFLDS